MTLAGRGEENEKTVFPSSLHGAGPALPIPPTPPTPEPPPPDPDPVPASLGVPAPEPDETAIIPDTVAWRWPPVPHAEAHEIRLSKMEQTHTVSPTRITDTAFSIGTEPTTA